jgi:hypothetical protein
MIDLRDSSRWCDPPVEPFGYRLSGSAEIRFAPLDSPRLLLADYSDPATHPAGYMWQALLPPGRGIPPEACEPWTVFTLAPDCKDKAWNVYILVASEHLLPDGRVVVSIAQFGIAEEVTISWVRGYRLGYEIDVRTGQLVSLKANAKPATFADLPLIVCSQIISTHIKVLAWYRSLVQFRAQNPTAPVPPHRT